MNKITAHEAFAGEKDLKNLPDVVPKKIIMICGSQRPASRSLAVASLLERRLDVHATDYPIETLDLGSSVLPLWDEDFRSESERWVRAWDPVSAMLAEAAGFIVLVPEWGGMAPPSLKNLFLLCERGEMAHKPGLIIAVSSGMGGAYPVAELRLSSYKNTHICWIPEHVIVRDARSFISESEEAFRGVGAFPQLWQRVDYAVDIFMAYVDALGSMRTRGIVDYQQFPYGM